MGSVVHVCAQQDFRNGNNVTNIMILLCDRRFLYSCQAKPTRFHCLIGCSIYRGFPT